jgi:hypothetical protein
LPELSGEQLDLVIVAAMFLGGFIVKLTPTKKDDEWWQKLKGLGPAVAGAVRRGKKK